MQPDNHASRSLPVAAPWPSPPDPPVRHHLAGVWRQCAPARVVALIRCPGRWRMRDAGMATAEYAIATLAACGFAALLLAILRSGEVRGLLLGIIRRALAVQ